MDVYEDIKTGIEQAIKQADRELARIEKKERKKEMRAYRKMYRIHRNELVKHAKETREWDWGWLYESTIMQIRHMYEYYSAGNNVWQCDESKSETLGQLKHVLDLNDALGHLWDNYESNIIKNNDGSISVSEEGHKKYAAIKNREQELYEEIYSYIGSHLQYWWD